MKKYVAKLLVLFMATIFFTGCEMEDFVVDYDFTAIYFANRKIDRSIIIGEYDYIQVGVVLSGKVANNTEEWAKYHLNPDTVTGSGYTVLPDNYYTIENSIEGKDPGTFYVPSGDWLGMVKVTLNDQFVNDPLALTANYALGFELEKNNTSVDSILTGKEAVIITFKYISNAEGFYYHNGVATGGTEAIVYDQKVWELSTEGTTSVESNGLGNGLGGAQNKILIEINADNTVTLSSADGGLPITDLSGSRYDPDLRQFYLNYSYDEGGVIYNSTDTLVFRNRVVDGINQWDLLSK